MTLAMTMSTAGVRPTFRAGPAPRIPAARRFHRPNAGQGIGDAAKDAQKKAGQAAEDVKSQASKAFDDVVNQGEDAIKGGAKSVVQQLQGTPEEISNRSGLGGDVTSDEHKGGKDEGPRSRAEKGGARGGEKWDDVKGTGTEKREKGDSKTSAKGVDAARERASELDDWTGTGQGASNKQ
ncbi:hypothetical protein ACKKBG_A38660 [Auxenochlorella protothecoides x Auxenochlorella symbiontica]